MSHETGEAPNGKRGSRVWTNRVASEGYHRLRLGKEAWRGYRAASMAYGMNVSEFLRFVAANLDNILPHLRLFPPQKK